MAAKRVGPSIKVVDFVDDLGPVEESGDRTQPFAGMARFMELSTQLGARFHTKPPERGRPRQVVRVWGSRWIARRCECGRRPMGFPSSVDGKRRWKEKRLPKEREDVRKLADGKRRGYPSAVDGLPWRQGASRRWETFCRARSF